MSLFPQMLLDVHEELIVDLFAGGGGASLGIEMATGRQVDVAVNHDEAAVSLHEANHPQTRHFHSDVFEVDPREVTGGRPVGLLWASPDCTYHSKARGAKPIRHKDQKRRALAWVVTRWAGQVRPRCIMLENVEEFAQWGPLVAKRKNGRVVKASGGVAAHGERVPVWDQKLVPCPDRASHRFRSWVRSLERLGYEVEWRELRASDYGAPTIRKRLYVIARCDGEPIVWPEPTHGPGRSRPYRTAAECIDWTVPMLSIFATPEEAKEWARAWRAAGVPMGTPRRPLADATLRRIARGVVKYVLEAAEPFLVPIQNYGWGDRPTGLGDPMRTVTAHPKGGAFALAAPYLVPRYGERKGQEPRTRSAQRPAPVVVPSGNGGSLVAAFLAKHYGGVVGAHLDRPSGTVTSVDHHSLVAASLAKLRGTSSDADPQDPLHTVSAQGNHHGLIAAHIQRDFGQSVGHGAGEPLGAVTPGGGGKAALVAAFLQSYYGQGIGQELGEAMRTTTTKDRMGLVAVTVAGAEYVVVDIAMRMLQPRELYRAQGFPDSYRIARGADGERLTKTEQVRMVGNSVCPPKAAALVRANLPDLVVRDEARRMTA